MVTSEFPRKVMALASRLCRFLPSGRVAVPGLRPPTRVTGGRGSCGSEVAAEFWLTGRARAGYRRVQARVTLSQACFPSWERRRAPRPQPPPELPMRARFPYRMLYTL